MEKPPTYMFVFEDEAAAKLFVSRLAHYLKNVAIFRSDKEVQVIDGSDQGQREEILRLARNSSAGRIMIGEIELTVRRSDGE
jgi:hypothetical protein